MAGKTPLTLLGLATTSGNSRKALKTAGMIGVAAAVMRGVSYLLAWAVFKGPAGTASMSGLKGAPILGFAFSVFLLMAGIRAISVQHPRTSQGLVIMGLAAAGWSFYNTSTT